MTSSRRERQKRCVHNALQIPRSPWFFLKVVDFGDRRQDARAASIQSNPVCGTRIAEIKFQIDITLCGFGRLQIMKQSSGELPRDHNKFFAAGSINNFNRYARLLNPVPEFGREIALNLFARQRSQPRQQGKDRQVCSLKGK